MGIFHFCHVTNFRKLKLCKPSGILSQTFQTAVGKSFLPLPYTQATGVNYFPQVKTIA